MANDSLRRELDAIAMDLEKKGHSKLASIVDVCNHEIHSRKATVTKKPVTSSRVVAPARPKRKPQASTRVSKAAKVAGARKTLKDVRWARAELRDIAREFRKLGSTANARQMLRMAEDLGEDESELMEIVGPTVDVDNAVEGEDMDLDLDTPVDDEDGDNDADDACVCPDAVDDEVYDDEAPETYDDTLEGDDADDAAEDEELDDVKLDTVEACAKEIRAIARELRREGDHRTAAVMSRLASECTCNDTETEFDPSVVVIPLPETDGGAPPIDATNFALGDDEDLLDFAVEVVSDDDEAMEGDDEDRVEDEVDPEESKSAEEYIEASLSLARMAKALRREGMSEQAAGLMRKATTYKVIAHRKAASVAKVASKKR